MVSPMMLKTVTIALAASLGQTSGAQVVLTPLAPIERPMLVEIERDPITDSISAFAVARSSDGRLSIGCDPDRYRGLRVTVHSQAWFAGENLFTGRRAMPFRFDRGAAVNGRWDIEEDAAILRPRAQVAAFINAVPPSGRVTIRTRDIENREKDLVFSTLGGRSAVQQMLRACAASG